MKNELLKYYPYINNKQVFITGSPQFEDHFNNDNYSNKADFYTSNNLDLTKEYVCFSGDDYTTSPNDPAYLYDFAILSLNI